MGKKDIHNINNKKSYNTYHYGGVFYTNPNAFIDAEKIFKKYQLFLKVVPVIFILATACMFFILYKVWKINIPLFIIIVISSVMLLKEISTLLFSWRMRKNIMKPIQTLKLAVEEIRKGNYGYTIEGYHPNMVDDLMRSFNTMSLELKAAKDLEEKYEQNRKELIAGISHDLKTPITAILGYLEGIKEGIADSPEKMRTYMDIIYYNAKYTNTLIDDLFLLSKLDINRVEYDFVSVNIKDYFTDIFIEKKIELEEQNIDVTYMCLVDEDLSITLDSKMIFRVISNIVNNAKKYNDKEEKKINIELTQSGNKPLEIMICVKDNGSGIREEHLNNIFDVFYREDRARNKDIGGSGLGLSIARQLIEAHGGKIWAKSELGKSTTICFTLKDIIEKR